MMTMETEGEWIARAVDCIRQTIGRLRLARDMAALPTARSEGAEVFRRQTVEAEVTAALSILEKALIPW